MWLWPCDRMKKRKNHCFTGGVRPYIPTSSRFRDTRTLVKGILLFILQSREFRYLLQSSTYCLDLVSQFFFSSPKTCSDFLQNKTLSNQPDIIFLRLSAFLLPGRRMAALQRMDEYHRWLQVTQATSHCYQHGATRTHLLRPSLTWTAWQPQQSHLLLNATNNHFHWKCKCQ